MNETRVFGPPGTGKTTYLTRQIGKALEKYNPKDILVASFTNTASRELAGRNENMKDYIGTLHSHCYRLIGRPEVIGKDSISEFNKEFPAFRLSGKGFNVSVEDKQSEVNYGQTMGDYLLHETQVMRARLIPRQYWKQNVRMFDNAWEKFKKVYGVIDFTDMIENALEYEDIPNNAKIGFFDEAQDFTPLEFKVIRKWAKNMEHIIFSGDDDQLLYSWVGATPDSLIEGDADIRILSQSYRVPKVVQAYAEKWIKQVSKRQNKEYKPRDFEGDIIKTNLKINDSMKMIKEIESDLADGKSVMVLATCGYMIDSIIKDLKAHGIPFHNKYRVSNGRWNPIRQNGSFGAIGDFLRPTHDVWDDNRLYTIDELQNWTKLVKASDVMVRGAKKEIAEILKKYNSQEIKDIQKIGWNDGSISIEEIDRLFLEYDFIDFGKAEMLDWLESKLLASKREPLKYPIEIYKKNDIRNGKLDIKLTVGTIHSVKGGEADVVYIFPDLSGSAMQGYNKYGELKDSVIRTMYVGMTRAKEKLVLCDSESSYRVKWI